MNRNQWIPMEIHERQQETPSLVSFKLIPTLEGTRFDFQAGQCVKILVPKNREGIFAIASEPEEKRFIEFLIKDQVGNVSHELCQLQVGNRLQLSPPFGKGYPIERLKGRDILLVGMGSSLSPLRSLLNSILRKDQQFGAITFLYGARTIEDMPYRAEFDFWKKKVNLQLALSQPPHPELPGRTRVTELLPQLSFDSGKTVACICGTPTMQKEITNLLEKAGISKENIFLNY